MIDRLAIAYTLSTVALILIFSVLAIKLLSFFARQRRRHMSTRTQARGTPLVIRIDDWMMAKARRLDDLVSINNWRGRSRRSRRRRNTK